MVKVIEADVWMDGTEEDAIKAVGTELGSLVCVSWHAEQLPDIAQPAPPVRMVSLSPGGPLRPVQDPTPDPIPGGVRYRLHYKAK